MVNFLNRVKCFFVGHTRLVMGSKYEKNGIPLMLIRYDGDNFATRVDICKRCGAVFAKHKILKDGESACVE